MRSFFNWLKSIFSPKPAKAEAPAPYETERSDWPWMEIAKQEIGVEEIEGPSDNQRILEYHQATTLKATEDLVPWCSSFVSWALEKVGIRSTRDAWARSYLNWGDRLVTPSYGCVVIFSRGKSSGHVAFYVSAGRTPDTITVLGGNQSDMVCYEDYEKSRVLGYRWPKL